MAKKKSGAGGWFRAADIVASSGVSWDTLIGWAQTAGREETGSSVDSTYGRQALVLEERRGQVALAGVGKQGHDGLALVLGALGQLQRGPHGGAGRNAHEHALLVAHGAAGRKGVVVLDGMISS